MPGSRGRARGSAAARVPPSRSLPDASGNGYWLLTTTGNVYAFGDGSPVPRRTRELGLAGPRRPCERLSGQGYWGPHGQRLGVALRGRGVARRPDRLGRWPPTRATRPFSPPAQAEGTGSHRPTVPCSPMATPRTTDRCNTAPERPSLPRPASEPGRGRRRPGAPRPPTPTPARPGGATRSCRRCRRRRRGR